MFTGLVETTGLLVRRSGRSGTARALIETDLGPLSLGESVSVHGACLTVARIGPHGFEADISTETLARTTLGAVPLGGRVHLERATPVGARLGGHIVLGHVDGIGRVASRDAVGDTLRLAVATPRDLARFVAPKGSIAVDGVSLTLNGVTDSATEVTFDVMLVPHTLERTALGDLRPGSQVNIEVDVLARYVARQLELTGSASPSLGVKEGSDDVDRRAPGEGDERLLAKLRSGGFL